ncbi:hypothetical protein U732_1104 [Clostridium argentinense CDC 2741]|uniref:Uncharacterized protein n=1 Tax=Clostridium argentinense CDC 2741 TaxID=1418104 RepID=A0A0C1U2T6_9CLOT|nr:hypothetical protein [Clostridium argentinense]KIE47169.1 hypothetical protein U732_1104 [Clostridium argentinense CDC 2741]
MQVIIVEPFRNFKHRIRVTKQYERMKAKIEVFNHYLYIEFEEGD